MAEYIEREAVKDELLSWAVCIKHPEHLLKEDALHVIDSIAAADVAPVVHGKWIDGADSFGAKRGQYRVCSRCNICIPCVTEVAEPYWQYCPNCGSKNGR